VGEAVFIVGRFAGGLFLSVGALHSEAGPVGGFDVHARGLFMV
jgi:hypothetical protein